MALHKRALHVKTPLHCHIQGTACWRGATYSTWEIPEAVSPNGIMGAWCKDIDILQQGVCVCVCDRTRMSWANSSPHSFLCENRD